MANITLNHLRARRESLLQAREDNLQKLARLQEQETGFKFVLGEIEQMIEALEQDDRAEQQAEAERQAAEQQAETPAGDDAGELHIRDDGQSKVDEPAELAAEPPTDPAPEA